jgi:hypothetical protein
VAAGYFGVTQVAAAQQRADAREATAESARYAAETKVFDATAGALVARLPRPVGFTPSNGTPTFPCASGAGGVDACFETSKSPRPALDAFLASAQPLGLVLQKNSCGLSTPTARVRAMFGSTPPCSAFGTLGGLSFSASSFPLRDRAHSTRDHVAWSGSRVSVNFSRV